MEQNTIRFQRKRELGVIISDSFEFLKLEIKPISRLIIIYVLPLVLLYAVGQVHLQRNVLSGIDMSNQEKMMENIGPFYSNLFVYLFFGLFIQSLLVGTFYSYIEAYCKTGKGNFEFSHISSKFFSNSLLALGANLVTTIIIFIGIIMCIVPGFYFANTFSLAVFIFIYEKKSLSEALSRSWKLVNIQWWNTLIINLLGIIMVWIVSKIISLPGVVLGTSDSLLSAVPTEPQQHPTWYWVLSGLSVAIGTILLIIPYTFQAFQYFNLKEREEPTVNTTNIS